MRFKFLKRIFYRLFVFFNLCKEFEVCGSYRRNKKDIGDLDMKVPPLLFINLVENAFKHGVSGSTKNAAFNFRFITIFLFINNSCTTFTRRVRQKF